MSWCIKLILLNLNVKIDEKLYVSKISKLSYHVVVVNTKYFCLHFIIVARLNKIIPDDAGKYQRNVG